MCNCQSNQLNQLNELKKWEPLNQFQIYQLGDKSIDNLVEMYRRGFNILDEGSKYNPMFGINKGIFNLGTSTCPLGNEIVTGTSKIISITPSGGTPPYTINWKVDGVIKNTWSNIPSGQVQSFNWTFNESLGNHVYLAEVVDSCPISALLDYSSCTVNIVAQATPSPTPTVTPSPTPTITPTPTTSPPPSGCPNCDLTNNLCIANTCIPKNYAIYGGAAAGFLLLLVVLK